MKLKQYFSSVKVEVAKDKEVKKLKKEIKILHEYCEELEKKLDKETSIKKIERLESELNHNIKIKKELREDIKNLKDENKDLKDEVKRLKQQLEYERDNK